MLREDLQTLQEPVLKKLCYETLEEGLLDAQFMKDLQTIRGMTNGSLPYLGPDDCTLQGGSHNFDTIARFFGNKLYNFVKVDGDEVAKLTCSSSKAGAVDKDKFEKIQGDGTSEKQAWETQVDRGPIFRCGWWVIITENIMAGGPGATF